MSTRTLPVPYQIETFGEGLSPAGTVRRISGTAQGRTRPGAFLAQLIAQSDGTMRGVIGRQDVAQARETAYGAALANRPSIANLATKGLLGFA